MTENYKIEVKELTKNFGDLKVLDHISFKVKKGEFILSLIHIYIHENAKPRIPIVTIPNTMISTRPNCRPILII